MNQGDKNKFLDRYRYGRMVSTVWMSIGGNWQLLSRCLPAVWRHPGEVALTVHYHPRLGHKNANLRTTYSQGGSIMDKHNIANTTCLTSQSLTSKCIKTDLYFLKDFRPVFHQWKNHIKFLTSSWHRPIRNHSISALRSDHLPVSEHRILQ
jgi:hypothetical protein